MKKLNNKYSGFTLIELILYIAITSIILLSISTLISFVLRSDIKNKTIMEVEQQGSYITEQITQNIRNAQSIISPTIGSSSDTLELYLSYVSEEEYDFVSFYPYNGQDIIMKTFSESDNSDIQMNNDYITITDISFQNISADNTSGSINFSFKITYSKMPTNRIRNEYNYSKTFYGAASLRKNQ